HDLAVTGVENLHITGLEVPDPCHRFLGVIQSATRGDAPARAIEPQPQDGALEARQRLWRAAIEMEQTNTAGRADPQRTAVGSGLQIDQPHAGLHDLRLAVSGPWPDPEPAVFHLSTRGHPLTGGVQRDAAA